jgi:hypothetical protein
MTIEIEHIFAQKIGFASHQNAVPILRELELTNKSGNSLENVAVELVADPPFIETKTWRIDRLNDGTTIHITERDVKLNAGFLANLAESISGHLTLRVIQDEKVLATATSQIEVLARNE